MSMFKSIKGIKDKEIKATQSVLALSKFIACSNDNVFFLTIEKAVANTAANIA